METPLRWGLLKIRNDNQRVRFDTANSVTKFNSAEIAVMITCNSGADGHNTIKSDQKQDGLPILRPSRKRVGVANGGTSTGKCVTKLPFKQLSSMAAPTDTFKDFPTSMMNVGKTCDDGNISIFTGDGVTVHKEQDVPITCKGEPILVGVRD